MAKDLLKEQIYQFVASNMQSGVFLPGDKISEEPIAKSLGVSRTPVREALNQLAFEGFIKKVPYKGFYVNEIDMKVRTEVFEAIAYLDTRVAELAIPCLDQSDYTKMKELIAKIDLAIEFENFPDYSKYQVRFHNVYADKCPNTVLQSMIDSLKFNYAPHTYLSTNKEVFKAFQVSNEEHKKILDAFIAKDIDKVKELIQGHWGVIGAVELI